MGAKGSKHKDIMREVKNRMVNGGYEEVIKVRKVKSVDKVIMFGDRLLSREEIYKYYQTVAAMQENDVGVTAAIDMLMDKELFAAMDREQKERYVLMLATFYKALKDEYYGQRSARAEI